MVDETKPINGLAKKLQVMSYEFINIPFTDTFCSGEKGTLKINPCHCPEVPWPRSVKSS